jgi:ferritin-like metal-binding protein YciE
MELITLNDLFLHELQDYDAEQQLVDAYRKWQMPRRTPASGSLLAHLQDT